MPNTREAAGSHLSKSKIIEFSFLQFLPKFTGKYYFMNKKHYQRAVTFVTDLNKALVDGKEVSRYVTSRQFNAIGVNGKEIAEKLVDDGHLCRSPQYDWYYTPSQNAEREDFRHGVSFLEKIYNENGVADPNAPIFSNRRQVYKLTVVGLVKKQEHGELIIFGDETVGEAKFRHKRIKNWLKKQASKL